MATTNAFMELDENKKDTINRRNEKKPKHLKFFLLVFSKDDAQAQEAQAQKGQAQEAPRPTHEEQEQALINEHQWMSLFVITFV